MLGTLWISNSPVRAVFAIPPTFATDTLEIVIKSPLAAPWFVWSTVTFALDTTVLKQEVILLVVLIGVISESLPSW